MGKVELRTPVELAKAFDNEPGFVVIDQPKKLVSETEKKPKKEQTAKQKKQQKDYNAKPEVKKKAKERRNSPEYKEKQKAYQDKRKKAAKAGIHKSSCDATKQYYALFFKSSEDEPFDESDEQTYYRYSSLDEAAVDFPNAKSCSDCNVESPA